MYSDSIFVHTIICYGNLTFFETIFIERGRDLAIIIINKSLFTHAGYFETNFTLDEFLAHPSSPILQCNQSWPFEVIHVAWNKEIEGLAI
jgi:hypothetical protein